MNYDVRVEHKDLGFFSIYGIDAVDYHEAEKEAKQRFLRDFCNADTKATELSAFVIDKYKGLFPAKFCSRCNPLEWEKEHSMLANCQIEAYSKKELICENCKGQIVIKAPTSESGVSANG